MNRKLMIIVVGLPGSGKTVVSKHIAEKMNFTLYIMGDVIRRIAEQNNISPTPENLMKIAAQLREEKGKNAVALIVKDWIKEEDWPIVIDGVRSADELKVYSELTNCMHIVAVHSSPYKRFERLKRRGRPGDPREWAEFVSRDIKELSFGLGNVIALADSVLVNNGTLEELIEHIDKKMEEFTLCSGKYVWKYL